MSGARPRADLIAPWRAERPVVLCGDPTNELWIWADMQASKQIRKQVHASNVCMYGWM